MTIHTVPTPELDPYHCLVCQAHRCDAGWVSLDVDLMEGHAYLCGDCANAVTHARGGATSDVKTALDERIAVLEIDRAELVQNLQHAESEQMRVVPVEEIVPYVKKQAGRPRNAA